MSAVIVRDLEALWAKGFGFAYLEYQIPAIEGALYHRIVNKGVCHNACPATHGTGKIELR